MQDRGFILHGFISYQALVTGIALLLCEPTIPEMAEAILAVPTQLVQRFTGLSADFGKKSQLHVLLFALCICKRSNVALKARTPLEWLGGVLSKISD